MKKSGTLRAIILTAIVTAIAVFTITSILPIAIGDKVLVSTQEYEDMVVLRSRFDKLLSLEDFIKQNFYQDVSEVDFDTGILKGLFQALDDRYSEYYTKEEYAALLEEFDGSVTGIGAYITPGPNGSVEIVSPIEGSPAEAAGIMKGDLIIEVDGESTEEYTFEGNQRRIKGPAGTQVHLKIQRTNPVTNVISEIEMTITRARVETPAVSSEMKSDTIGYIRITTFDNKVSREFSDHLKKIQDAGAKAFVLDIRDNGGGDLDQVVEVADQLLGVQTIVTIVTTGEPDTVYNSNAAKTEMPFILLVNENSASASEILAGAIQDGHAAPVVGDVTFGKGIVQTVRGLMDGTGFKLTVSRYLTPSGADIQDKGITPDLLKEELEARGFVTAFDEEGNQTTDGVLDYAIDYLQKELAR